MINCIQIFKKIPGRKVSIMSELIQKISVPLLKKLKESIGKDEKIYFCIEGVKGNSLIGTNKKLYVITAGSFKGCLSYAYDYDNIQDIKITPPLYGPHITMNIIADKEDKELKPRLYFNVDQNELLKEVLTKISSISKSYTYIEPIKEMSITQSDTNFIVPMKNILGKMYKENIKSSEKVSLSLSLGDFQGLVITDKRVLIFKINEKNKTTKVGTFSLDEITAVEYSVGLVTGNLQIITPKVTVIKKKLKEQDLINVDNIVSFSKKNFGEIMEEVSKRLKELTKKNKESKEEKATPELEKKPPKEPVNINVRSTVELEEISLDDISSITQKKEPSMVKVKEKPKPEEVKNIDEIFSSELTDINKDQKTSKEIFPSMEDMAQKLSKEILEEIKFDEQQFYYTREIVKQIAQEVVKHSFPDMASSSLIDLITNYVMENLSTPEIFMDDEEISEEIFDVDNSDLNTLPVEEAVDTLAVGYKPKEVIEKSSEEQEKKVEINQVILKILKEKISFVKINSLKKIINKRFSEKALSGELKKLNFSKEEIELILLYSNLDNKELITPVSTPVLPVTPPSVTSSSITPPPPKTKKTKNPVVEKKLAEFTSLKNISAALLVDTKDGNIIYKSIIEDGPYEKVSNVGNSCVKTIKASPLALAKSFVPQWKAEYEKGIIYLEEVNTKYVLMIIGTEKSNFGTLKLFIEKNKEALKKALI